jgi:hypothetical protein
VKTPYRVYFCWYSKINYSNLIVKAMSKYLVTYHNAAMPNDPVMMEQAKAAFGKWLQSAGKSIVDPGAPVRMVKQVSGGNQSAAVEIGGYSIIQAPSIEDAVKVLQSHPFVSRGGTLQVNEIIGI